MRVVGTRTATLVPGMNARGMGFESNYSSDSVDASLRQARVVRLGNVATLSKSSIRFARMAIFWEVALTLDSWWLHEQPLVGRVLQRPAE